MTAPSRASSCSRCPAGPCNTTRRRVPVRTTACTCSTASWSALPRRSDIRKILILGSGPIIIGQAAEFDYSGVQACKVLREEGYEVVLVNSNPATIMTDPEFATATYVEPLLPGPVTQVIERERPDALLPTLGGQTALNLAKSLHEDGTLERFAVELIGANYDAINRAEAREEFDATIQAAGQPTAGARAIGVWTAGSNVQGAINPVRQEIIGIETNPRVSRSSALGWEATVVPIAKIAGRLAGDDRLDEILNDITRRGLASVEP